MAADSEPESEVFEITDFTTASEWERFISKIEEVLNDWKLIGISSGKPLEKGIYTTGAWEEKSDEISFADFKFSVTHHYLVQEPSDRDGKEEPAEDALPLPMQDLLCMNNDFPPRAHCLVRWYGLREFVVIAPAANNDAVLSESKCNLLLSSVSIALGNTGCQVPLFVQIHQKWRRMYVGECQGPGVRTDFEMVHLRKVPNQYTHLSGLLDIFKSKIGCPLMPLPPVSMAIRLTYVLQDWQQYFWPQQPPDIDALVGGEVGGLEFGKLPFGACEDPISELHLATTWPHLTEGIIVDNDVYSDLDPIQAPQWSVRIRKADNPQCLLGDFLNEFFKLCRRKESTDEILGRSAFEEDGKGEPLYIPITQEPAPMTEDLLEEQSEVLAKLGTSAEGAHLRARMQSACLLSDMESFKAANPGCCLEDFVRWYSPRDYIEEEVVDEKGNVVIKGELSARMKIPSNMWVEAWETAKPVPARRQKRLFDDTREAEKVLHYLAVQKPADLARHLLSCIIHAAVLKVKEEEVLEDISSVKKIIKQIISHSSKVLRFPNPEDKKLEEIIAQIMSVEAIIARARSLKAKFGVEKCENEEEKEDLQRFVNCLLEQPEVSVLGAGRGPAGSVIHKLFVNAQRVSAMPPLDEELRRSGSSDERRLNTGAVPDFPPPTGREVILRTTVPRPAPYSKPLPQRIFSAQQQHNTSHGRGGDIEDSQKEP
ncbi:Rab3 GTPase-activating protein catalytic subunit isoform X1 [Aix galericulata]|nr:Rab3 GTPase-activating protein catalytic subunit isoform X1 [Aix galericulata]